MLSKSIWNILKTFLIIFSLCNLGCALFGSHKDDQNLSSDFEQGKYLVSIAEYDKAEPYLIQTMAREDEHYAETLLLLGKIYDQTAMPEKSILNLKDFISRSDQPLALLKAKGLLLKNLAKVKVDIENTEEKKFITRIMTSKDTDIKVALEDLRWTMDFDCDLYCVEEISYLKEIQVQLIYAIERDPSVYKRASDILTSRYDFFEIFLNEQALDPAYRRNIALALYDALQKLPRNASPVRLHNRCKLTGRPKGYMRDFGICRNQFRDLASMGKIPGVTKSSW